MKNDLLPAARGALLSFISDLSVGISHCVIRYVTSHTGLRLSVRRARASLSTFGNTTKFEKILLNILRKHYDNHLFGTLRLFRKQFINNVSLVVELCPDTVLGVQSTNIKSKMEACRWTLSSVHITTSGYAILLNLLISSRYGLNVLTNFTVLTAWICFFDKVGSK